MIVSITSAIINTISMQSEEGTMPRLNICCSEKSKREENIHINFVNDKENLNLD